MVPAPLAVQVHPENLDVVTVEVEVPRQPLVVLEVPQEVVVLEVVQGQDRKSVV